MIIKPENIVKQLIYSDPNGSGVVTSYYRGTERSWYPRGNPEDNIKAILNQKVVLKEIKSQRDHIHDIERKKRDTESPVSIAIGRTEKKRRLHFSQISTSLSMK